MKKIPIKFHPKKLTRKQQKRLWVLFLTKLGFRLLTPTDKVAKARKIVTAMTGNANFPTPNPTLASIGLSATALEAAQQALDGTKIRTLERNAAMKALDLLMSLLQAYVDTASMQQSVKILSAGFELRDPATTPGVLAAPVSLTATSTTVEGQVKIKCKAIKKKLFYVVEAALDFPGIINWELVAQSSKATILVNELNPGQKYRLRMRVVNSAGLSVPSEEVTARPIQY